MRDERIKDKKFRKARCESRDEILLPIAATKDILPPDYPKFLSEVKALVSAERTRALVSANVGMTLMYWRIGKMIVARQDGEGWGAKVIDRLSYDLKKCFPGASGFSPRNLKYMRKFALAWPNEEFVQRTVAQIAWRSNLSLLDKLSSPEERLWYARETARNGWSKEWLDICIESRIMDRVGRAPSNFPQTLSMARAKKIQETFKDPYVFDFLGIDKPVRENELEDALVSHVEDFLLELGNGFAFVGRQVHVEFCNQDFYLDLLFYHLKLRCFVVVELKVGKFDPGDAAQLGFYQTVVDHTMRHPSDAPTIGLLLVKEKNDTIVRYSLEGMRSPMGVAEWQTAIEKSMPEDMKSVLPTIEAIEAEMSEVDSLKSTEKRKTAVTSIPVQHPASRGKKDHGKAKRRKGGKKS